MFRPQAEALAKTLTGGSQDVAGHIQKYLELAYKRGREDKAAEIRSVIGAAKEGE